MDNLINRWKQTVENHNRKLSQLREDSLGRSVSKERSVLVSKESLQMSSSMKQVPQTELKNQKDLRSSLSPQHRRAPLNKENKQSLANTTTTTLTNSLPLKTHDDEEDQDYVQLCLDQLLSMFPDTKLKTKKREKVLTLLGSHYADRFKTIKKLQREVKAKEAEKRETVFMNEATTKKISELEVKLQESERERHKSRMERDDLLRQLQNVGGDSEDKKQ